MISRILLLQSLLIAISSFQPLVSAASIARYASTPSDVGTSIPRAADIAVRDTKPFYLRILPLGASITWGLLSTDGNGYRGALREQLVYEGWPVNMVGTLTHGKMEDNNNEGHSGWRVDQIANAVDKVIPMQPNLILINAGTNDCAQGYHIDKISNRMDDMLDHLYKQINGTTIVFSTLLPNNKTKQNACVQEVNKKYRTIVSDRQEKKQKIVLADMDDGFIVTSELKDGTHPTDAGYRKMASVWVTAIHDAVKRNFITKPADTDTSDVQDKVTTSTKSTCGTTKFDHESQNMKRIFGPARTTKPENFYDRVSFAQLVNDFASKDRIAALDDLVWDVLPGNPDHDPGYYTFINNDGKFGPIKKIDTKGYCNSDDGARLAWGDVDGDGLADYICLGPEGNIDVSINKGGNPPKFDHIGQVKKGPDGLNVTNIRLGDIDGDGRVDYCALADNGDLSCSRNNIKDYTKIKDFEKTWKSMGKGPIFQYKGGDINSVRLVDIDGDDRADVLSVDDTGKVTTWVNTVSSKDTLLPEWQDAGVTHQGMKVSGSRDKVKFGRVFSGGLPDYNYFESEKDGDNYNNYIHTWKNTKFAAEACQSSNSDDGQVTDPKLPTYSPHSKTRRAPI
ncbi:SGNH hydrolase-type esterase domain-containing protein [Whalleya microplaca]|nr:SGNH hydrolase-type esterase domain-containing protein [Whalleya microplaca]